MCGICGVVNFDRSPVNPADLRTMMSSMKHRGPDDEGIYVDNNVGFGHVRLSILDLSEAGHQPMFFRDNQYCITYNGEIFNYLELRSELSSKYEFETNTDTEVVLASYIEWGEKCLDKFNGMWAFAIHDRRTNQIYLSRDRYGIKPLYCFKSKNSLIFASEVKALVKILKEDLAVNERSVYEYLIYNRTDQTESTFYHNINKLKHGHSISIKDNEFKIIKWYDLKDKNKFQWNSPEEFRNTLSSAVGLRLRSDVPVGTCLSGGLDSSTITSILLKDYDKGDLNTFSAVYGTECEGDESIFIDEYKEEISNLHFIYPTAKTLLNDTSRFTFCQFEPASLGAYSQYKVFEKASEFVKVTIDGQGADEQLAGYHYFYGSYILELFRSFKIHKALIELCYCSVYQRSFLAFKYLIFYLMPDFFKKYFSQKKIGWLDKDFCLRNMENSTINGLLYSPKSLRESLYQHFESKLEHLLKWGDLNSMAFSIEARVPFLDYRIVERTLSSSSDIILNKGVTKWILRESMKNILPEKIRQRRDKIGFGSPADDWFREKYMMEMIFDILDSKVLNQSGYLNVDFCKKRYNLHFRNRLNISQEIWRWISLYFFLSNFRKRI